MTASQQQPTYLTLIRRYWETYLPSEVARMSPDDREPFFRSLATDVEEAIEAATTENLAASSRPGDSPAMKERRRATAAARAREEVLTEMVYLPKEPGTSDRTMPTSLPSSALPSTE